MQYLWYTIPRYWCHLINLIMFQTSGGQVVDQRIFLHEAFKFSTKVEKLHVLVPITFQAPNVKLNIWTEVIEGLAQPIKDRVLNTTNEDQEE